MVILDGAADEPIDELGGVTPFEAAETPHLDRAAREGRMGTVRTTPEGFSAGSDVCCMTLLGFSAAEYHTGRAPLEAAALGLDVGPEDWVFRVNLVTADGERMLDHSAGHITDAKARELIGALSEAWRERAPGIADGLSLTPGVSYRNILTDSSGRDYAAGDGLRTTPPHDIPGEAWRKHMPRGTHAEEVATLMEISREVFASHAVNAARIESGQRPATMAWIWGQGTRPGLPRFADVYGVRACIITAVDLLAGIASYLDIDRLAVPGITGYHDTDYGAKGEYARSALDRYDMVIVHVEAPDEASHQADYETKIASIERIDECIVGPLLERLESFGRGEAGDGSDGEGWRFMALPDHYTLVRTRKHDATPVPFAMAGSWVRSVVSGAFSEETAKRADLHIDPGEGLMEYFLYSGLKRPYARSQSRSG